MPAGTLRPTFSYYLLVTGERFEELALPHSRALYGYAVRLVDDKERARDLVQDAFLNCWRNRSSLSAEKIRATLFCTLRHRAIDIWRKEQRDPPLCELSESDYPEVPLEGVLSEEMERALGGLPDSWRETLWLRDVEGFSYLELGEITGVPIGTVRSRLARARRAMFSALQRAREEVARG